MNMRVLPFGVARAVDSGVALASGMLLLVVCLIVLAVWRDWRATGGKPAQYAAFRVLWLFCKLYHGFRPRGRDPLERSGPVLIVSNHTSPADPLYLQCCTRRVIRFLMAREFFHVKPLQPMFRAIDNTILVNRTGRDTAATKATLRALGEGQVICIFPEGGIHLDPGTLGEAKPGAAMLALLTRVPVVPAFIDRPVHTNRLVDGILRPVPTRVFYGRPIDLSRYYGRRHDREVLQEVAGLMMKAIEELRPNNRVRTRC